MDQGPVQKMCPEALKYVVKMPRACQELPKENKPGASVKDKLVWPRGPDSNLQMRSSCVARSQDSLICILQPRPLSWVPDTRAYLSLPPQCLADTALASFTSPKWNVWSSLPKSASLPLVFQEKTLPIPPPFPTSHHYHMPVPTLKSTLNSILPSISHLYCHDLAQATRLSNSPEFFKWPLWFSSCLSFLCTAQGCIPQ